MFYKFLTFVGIFVVANSYRWWGQELPTTILTPIKFVRNFISFESNRVLPYTDIQILLEDEAEENGMYYGTKQQDKEILARILRNETVKELLKRCKTFRKKCNCKNKKLYRTPDGVCNNLQYPYWGAADGPMVRWLPPNYIGIREFKRFGELPEPRFISLKLKDMDNPSRKISAFFTFFGQFIAHDISLSPIKWASNDIPCCEPRYQNATYCRCNIYTKPDDPFFSKYNVSCMRFRRTAPYPQCNFNKRMQINKNSAFLDTNIVYGSNNTHAKLLRANDNTGKLYMELENKAYILPPNRNNESTFCPINQTTSCFFSGDDRVNQHVMLSSVHTMFLRLHNKIAENLKKMNPHWNGHKLYHESRRILGALYQYIVYNEYLPLLLGTKYDEDLFVKWDSWYDSKLKPHALIESTTAAFRLHSMVPTVISKYNPEILMRDTFAYSEPVHSGIWSKLVAGSCETPTQKFDRFLVADLTNYLYSPKGADFGFELTAINIQRGRDHGLPPYIEVVRKCSKLKKKIKTFTDLRKWMTSKNILLLKKIYKKVKDIDLWIGMMMENPVKGGQVGPTAACILSMQFHRLKFGDSFFFTHKNGRHPFTKNQLSCIRKYSAARFLCDTIDYHEVREKPFLLPSKSNKMVQCKNMPKLNLSVFKEKRKGRSHQEM